MWPKCNALNAQSVFSTPWSAIVNSVIELADSHHTLAAKIETDVERPLREFQSKNREMQAMSTIQGNCQSMARDIEKAQKSSEKLENKGGRASTGRVAHVSRDLDTAQSQWESQAPYVFETLQALDESRLNHLRDVLTQLQTHEVDLVERNRIGAEQCLNTLLTVETADEIKTFAAKTVQNKDQLVTRPRRQSASAPSPLIDRIPGPSIPDDRASQRSDSGEFTHVCCRNGSLMGQCSIGSSYTKTRKGSRPQETGDRAGTKTSKSCSFRSRSHFRVARASITGEESKTPNKHYIRLFFK